LNNEYLQSCNCNKYTNEHAVCVDSLKNVDFIVNLSSTNHIEDLKPYK